MPRTFHCEIFADHHQFYLQDDGSSSGDLSAARTQEATDRMLAVAPHVIDAGTVRHMAVPVSVVVHETQPKISPDEWGHITTANLQIDSGRIVLAGCTDEHSDAIRTGLVPGMHEAIICHARLGSLSEDGLDGGDACHVHLFPGRAIEAAVLKQWQGGEPVVAANSACRRGWPSWRLLGRVAGLGRRAALAKIPP